MADFKYKIDWVPDAKKQRNQVEEEAVPQGIASRPTPTKPAKKEDDYYTKMYNIMSAYFDTDEEAEQALSSKKPDAAKAKQITMEEFERMAEASADRGRAMREDRGITQSLVEGGGEAYRTKPPEGTITRPVARPDDLVTDTAKDVEESAPVTAETKGAGLMSDPRNLGGAEGYGSVGTPPEMSKQLDSKGSTGLTSFYEDIGKKAESDHGSTPVTTKDARETEEYIDGKLNPNYVANPDDRSKDVGYGHKVTAAEDASGKIRGVTFKNADGTYKELTEEDKVTILNADMQAHKDAALEAGWNTKLANINTSWNELGPSYQRALTSLAYNVGGKKAGEDWTAVLRAAKDKNVVEFARQLRRKDAGRYTAGMDNRVMKELKFAGLIDKRSEVSSVLPLATAGSGIPD